MRPPGKVVCLTLEASTSPCSHICRYCSIGDRGGKFPLKRWMSFVEGFEDWANTQGPPELTVQGGFCGPSYDFSLPDFITVSEWYERRKNHGLSWIPLGGLKMRPQTEMREWLKERHDVGLNGVSAAFVGTHGVHDRWNGRHGDFDFLFQTLHTAAELGLQHGTTIFVTKSSLPLLTDLAALLDTLPTPHQGRHARLFFYIGHGAHHEEERISESDRDKLPELARSIFTQSWPLYSEREWIKRILSEHEESPDIFLHLELTSRNIENLARQPYEKIFADLKSRALADFAKFPTMRELCETSADRDGTRLYSIVDIERLWLDRFLEEKNISVDHKLLHYHLGRSARPPRLWDPPEPHEIRSVCRGQANG